jgi:hypothetical protein
MIAAISLRQPYAPAGLLGVGRLIRVTSLLDVAKRAGMAVLPWTAGGGCCGRVRRRSAHGLGEIPQKKTEVSRVPGNRLRE